MMKNFIENIIKENKIMVIDGSMSTPLENRGVSLNSKLWTAKILAEQPELIKQVHKNYFKAGADCGITCSYQASIPGLMENGYTLEEAENLIRSAVKIFCEARDEWWEEEEGREAGRAWPLCLGAAGPYGAYLADGSEYRGNYGITDEQLKEFHKRRVELLHEAGADIIMLDNMTPEMMKEAVELIAGRAQTECSGNITKENIAKILETGVDFVSSGALTHSAPILDISMKNLHAI